MEKRDAKDIVAYYKEKMQFQPQLCLEEGEGNKKEQINMSGIEHTDNGQLLYFIYEPDVQFI